MSHAFTKFYGNSTFMEIVWILVKKLWSSFWVFFCKNMNKKTWCQKISNVYWMDARYIIFSPMFSCDLRENIFSVLKKRTYFLPFAAELHVIVTICDTMIGKNIWCLPWKWEICFRKMFAHKTGLIFFSKPLRSSPWGHRKNIGENIFCIHLVDIVNFLVPYFFVHVFAKMNSNIFYQNSCNHHQGRIP